MAHHRQVSVDVIKYFVGGVVVTSSDPRVFGVDTRIAVIHSRLQKQTFLNSFQLPQTKVALHKACVESVWNRTCDASVDIMTVLL